MSRQLVTSMGVGGVLLGVAAGLTQALVGEHIPEWTGDKLETGGLGLLTIGLSLIAGLAVWRQQVGGRSVLTRAACAVGMAGPGLLCLTTVGRLGYLPALLLTVAGVRTVERWRATGAALADHWGQVLLSALGGCVLLAIAAGPPAFTLVGGLVGTVLIVAPWRRSPPGRQGGTSGHPGPEWRSEMRRWRA